MKIYFTASARSRKSIPENIDIIFKTIQKMGHKHLDDFVVTVNEKELYEGKACNIKDISRNAERYIHQSDVVILEVSEPSISMGFVLSSALEQSKAVILLHTKNKFPIFLAGLTDENLQVIEYNLGNLTPLLNTALIIANENRFIRFNFFISPDQDRHMVKMSRQLHMPKSAYLRSLIDKDILQEEQA